VSIKLQLNKKKHKSNVTNNGFHKPRRTPQEITFLIRSKWFKKNPSREFLPLQMLNKTFCLFPSFTKIIYTPHYEKKKKNNIKGLWIFYSESNNWTLCSPSKQTIHVSNTSTRWVSSCKCTYIRLVTIFCKIF